MTESPGLCGTHAGHLSETVRDDVSASPAKVMNDRYFVIFVIECHFHLPDVD